MRYLAIVLLSCVMSVAQIGIKGWGIGPGVGFGSPSVAGAVSYRSVGPGTQIHASANHWGNSNSTHHLLDTFTTAVTLHVSRASWNPGNTYTTSPSLINIYDAGWVCLAGNCLVGKMYAHTGPLLSSQTNPNGNFQISVPLVADINTVCPSYPCDLPPGTYSVTTGSSDLAADTMSTWGDGTSRNSGGAEFHIANSFGNTDNAFIAASVVAHPTNTPSGGNTIVGVLGTMMLTVQPMLATSTKHNGFAVGMIMLVAGLKDSGGPGGPTDVCNGLKTITGITPVSSGSPSGTLTYTLSGSHTCDLDTVTSATCEGISGPTGFGAGCVGAGIPPVFDQLLADQGNGFMCYVDGSECGRSDFVGPGGPQTGAHSTGMMIY